MLKLAQRTKEKTMDADRCGELLFCSGVAAVDDLQG